MTVPPSPAPDWMCVVTAVEEPTTTFIRPDGHEKVTGTGRYTADLTLTGQLARGVPLRRPHARADHADRHDDGTRAPRRARRRHARGRARRALRRHGQGPAALRTRHGALRGRHRRRRRGDDRRDRARRRRRSSRSTTSRSPSSRDFEAALARRRDARPPRLGVVRGRRGARAPRQHARVLDDREGRRRRGARRERTSSSAAAT